MSRWRERVWNRDSAETGVLLGKGARAIADHGENRRSMKRRKEIYIYIRFNKWRRQPHRAEQHRPPPHHTQTQTDRGAIFSHRSDWLKEVTGISLSHRLLSDRLPLSPTSSFPSIWSPSFYLANLIFRKALGYLHTPAHTALYNIYSLSLTVWLPYLHHCCFCGSLPLWEVLCRNI